MSINYKAALALYPNIAVIDNDTAFDIDNNVIELDLDALNSWVDPEAYIAPRIREYPSIGDQLDALFHAGVFPEEMAATIQAVKDKYPKGGS